jgi:hypothetical protein
MKTRNDLSMRQSKQFHLPIILLSEQHGTMIGLDWIKSLSLPLLFVFITECKYDSLRARSIKHLMLNVDQSDNV